MDEQHYMETATRSVLAAIWLAQGETKQATEESTRSAEFARSVRDPQALYPSLAGHIRVLVEVGRREEADAIADELLRLVAESEHHASYWVLESTTALVALGRARDAQALVQGLQTSTRWRDAARAYADGDFEAAADVLGEIGARTEEARARLAAAEAGAGRDQLDPAIAFFRSVGATALLHRAQTLISASA